MIRVSAPGKAILMGEHAAVYGRPALVAALDRRVRVELRERSTGPAVSEHGTGVVELDLPELGIRRSDTWRELRNHAMKVREAWVRMNDGSDPEATALTEIAASEDRSQLARIALGEALEALDADPSAHQELEDVLAKSLRVSIRSGFPVGSGFGSSAAIAVAVIRAVFELAGREISDERLHAASLEVERRQHGAPSGVDNATVIHGGVLWVERDGAKLRTTPLDANTGGEILGHLRIYQTGEPAESTGEVVSAVRTLRLRDERAFDRRLRVMEETAASFRELLTGVRGSSDELFRAIDAMRRFESCLEAFGVVPDPVAERIRRIEEAGGAAKISGAGSLAGPGAGSLLVLHPRPEILDELDALGGYQRLEVQLGGDGLRVDPRQAGAE